MDRYELLNNLESSIKRRVVSELGLTATAGIGVAIFLASKKVLDRKFSPAARDCSDAESIKEKTRCMNAYKVRALKAQKQHILSGKMNCKDTDCYSYLDNRLAQIDSEIGKLS